MPHTFRHQVRWTLLSLAALTVGAVAYILLQVSSAATYAVGREAESVAPVGSARQIAAAGASGGNAVMFGGTGTGGNCTTPSDRRLRDQSDPSDIKKPWRKTTPELILYFDTKALPPEYADYARQGAESWSRSECIDARVTSACPSGSICIPMTMTTTDREGVVGTTYSSANSSHTVSARIEIYTRLNNSPANKRRMTTIHEIGHACRLAHRASSSAIMFTPSRGENSILPDADDLHNLRVLYGPTADTFPAMGGGPLTESIEHFY